MELLIVWLSLIIILAILELITQWLTTFCLAIGCIGALLTNLVGGSLTVQLIVLAVVTLLTLIIAGPRFKARYARQGQIAATQSNMEALRGRQAVVTERISSDHPGRVKLDGDCWQALSQYGSSFEVGQNVEIVGYESIILFVK
jgi:membrane protein implicated in regulation of membrane protease activity